MDYFVWVNTFDTTKILEGKSFIWHDFVFFLNAANQIRFFYEQKQPPEKARPATLLKKRIWHKCFPVNFAKFLRAPFLQNTSWRLDKCLVGFFICAELFHWLKKTTILVYLTTASDDIRVKYRSGIYFTEFHLVRFQPEDSQNVCAFVIWENKYFAKFTGKHLCQRGLQYSKRDTGTCAFQWILRNF